ncbi:MAG: hypothetical protein LBL60_02090 [Mycoplasmataceae bacterium]|nr:hypothetical protein [Mycoplasmataceae bacterium]
MSVLFDKYVYSQKLDINKINDWIFAENISYGRVLYQYSDKKKFEDDVNKYINDNGPFPSNDNIWIQASMFCKNNWYRYEKEYRFVIINQNEDKKDYLDVELDDSLKRVIKSITISPYCKVCKCNLEKQCNQNDCLLQNIINSFHELDIEVKNSLVIFK